MNTSNSAQQLTNPASPSTRLQSIPRPCGWLGIFALLVLLPFGAYAGTIQDAAPYIQFNPATRVFRIDAADMTYVLGVNENQRIQTLYWGSRLAQSDQFATAKSAPGFASFDPSIDTTPQEFVGWGGGLYVEPDLKITFPDGNRDLALQYVSYQISGNELAIVMKDISRAVYVTLRYKVDPETGILRRSAEIENRTDAPFTIEQAFAATWNLPRGTGYRLRYLTGRWAGEWNLQEQPVRPGKTVLESRRGTTGAQNNPWFAIDHSGDNDQRHGDVWFGALGWSGSWEITVEQDALRHVRISGGFNSFDFGYLLQRLGRRLRRRIFMAGTPVMVSAAHRACSIVSRSTPFFLMRPVPGCAPCSTTHGKPPALTSTRPARWSLPRKLQA